MPLFAILEQDFAGVLASLGVNVTTEEVAQVWGAFDVGDEGVGKGEQAFFIADDYLCPSVEGGGEGMSLFVGELVIKRFNIALEVADEVEGLDFRAF